MSVIAIIYSVVQAVLQLIGLWDQFLDYSDSQRLAESQAKQQTEDAAVDDSVTATTDDQIWKDQDAITKNKP